ncbi:MAG: hypothetical protein J2P21_18810 [Chloracidobacterium sp.]|nr:hypothetical protein [Chloracidobacterium sp.]
MDNMKGHILALGGDTVALASGASVKILRVTPTVTRQVTSFDVEMDVDWLEVAPDGQSALIWGGWATRLWRWRAGVGRQLTAAYKVRGDDFGGAFAIIRGEVIMFIAQHGVLRGVGTDGRERFAANLDKPSNFLVRSIAQLPGDRLALFGNAGSDPYNEVVTVFVDDIFNDPDSV